MKVAFIARSTLYSAPGGDTIQVKQTARHLGRLGVTVNVHLTHEKIPYADYSHLHFFNLTRPADILYHARNSRKAFCLSPIFIDYSEYDRLHRKGLAGVVLKNFSPSTNEYLKTLSRWIIGKDSLRSKSYLWKGQRRSMSEVIRRAALVLPNSEAEFQRLHQGLDVKVGYHVVPNGIDDELFCGIDDPGRAKNIVICAARIEGIKNQFNLIRAVNGTPYRLFLIGAPAPNQQHYYQACRRIAGPNIHFIDHIPQQQLPAYYSQAAVHALPSWFETCGLSSLEAAAMGCNIIITDRGYTREYFGDDAFYCHPGDPASIRRSIEEAMAMDPPKQLRERIFRQYTWKETASSTLEAYLKITSS